MIKTYIKLELKHPYKQSIDSLLDLCNIWNGTVIEANTNKSKAQIILPSSKFKKIFGCNPIVKKYKVPRGTEHFIRYVKVFKIKGT